MTMTHDDRHGVCRWCDRCDDLSCCPGRTPTCPGPAPFKPLVPRREVPER